MKYLIIACLCLAFGCSQNPVGVVENDEISLYKKPFPTPKPCPDKTKPRGGQKCK